MAPPEHTPESRRAEILAAAAGIFLRYGYRKTSMDEVARAADLSRPGLYLHFPTKEVLFRETVSHLLSLQLAEARAALAEPLPIEQRLVEALVRAHGPYVQSTGAAQHMAELFEAAAELAGEVIEAHEQTLHAELIGAVEAAAPALRLAPSELVELVELISTGLKYRSCSLPEYRANLSRATALLFRS